MPGAATVSPPFQAPFRVIKPSGGDDYAVAQAALNACLADGKEFIIGGQLRLSAGLVAQTHFSGGYPDGHGITIRGANPNCGLEPFDAAADGITLLTVGAASTSTASSPVVIRDLQFLSRVYATAMTGGCAISLGGASGQIEGARIDNVILQDMYDGIVLPGGDAAGAGVTAITNVRIVRQARYGIWIKGYTEQILRNIFIVRGGLPPAGTIGMLIESRDAIEVSHFDCVGQEIGIKIKPSGTTLDINGGYWFWNAMCDTGGTGWVIDGTGDDLDEIEMHGCWAGYNSGAGVVIKGSALQAVRWFGGIVQANLGYGFDIQSGHASDAQHVIDGVQILKNSTAGVNIASGVGGVTVRDNRITNAVNYGTGGGTQSHGIALGGTHQGLRIHGNDLRGNATGAITGDYSHSTNRVRDNLGLDPKGVLGPPAVPATTVAYTNAYGHDCTVYVAGGTVTAIAVGGTATGMTSGPIHVPAGQTITLTYSSAPTWTWFGG